MGRSRLQRCSILLLTVVILASCGGGSMQQVSIQGTEFRFDPATVTVKAGSPVQIALRNAGSQPHDWTVDSLDGQKVQGLAQPNQSTTISFTPSQPGTYPVYCAQPGHKEAGMVGQLTVQ